MARSFGGKFRARKQKRKINSWLQWLPKAQAKLQADAAAQGKKLKLSEATQILGKQWREGAKLEFEAAQQKSAVTA